MVKISERYNISATPKPFKGIQVNFCKTPNCPNFGLPSIIKKRPVGRPAKNSPPRDGYTLSPGEGIYHDTITHRCEICAEKFPIKSNQGIHEEYIRIKPEAPPHTLLKQVTCPNPECGSFGTVSNEIINRTCDALFIAITTSMTIDDKKAILDQVNATLKNLQKMFPEKSRNDIKLMLLRERLKEMDELGRWQDKFLSHPFPTIDEPEKKSCLLTDFNDLEIDHLAWLHNKASLRGINQYFMNVRRRLSLLERPLSTPSNLGRRFYGYNSYSPEVVAKILCIFRTYYNYCRKGKYGITPAMRLGMSRGSIRVEDIIYGRKYSNYSFDKNAQKIKEEDKKRDIARALKAAKRRKKTSRKNVLRKAQYKGFGTILEDFENRDTVFIDIETTGDKEKDTILEIAIVDDDGKILIDTIVNPKIPILEDAKNIHGISEEMATDKPTFSEIESQIINCIDGKLVIMFGAKFDLPYFPEKLKKLIDYECCMSWYSALQGRWNPESDSFQTINLESATYEIGYIWQGEQHRALPDAWACRAVWKYLLKIEQ